MSPICVGIGGDRSGSGKTLVASRLLRGLRGWGAIKCSPSELYTSVIDDPEVLKEPGKDTARFLEAGAEGVVWVKAPRQDIEEPLGIAAGKLSHLKGILVEGNSAIEALKENLDVIIFVASGEAKGLKNNTEALLGRADVVVYAGEPPTSAPEGAGIFRVEDEEGFVNYTLELIDGRKDKRGTQQEIG